MTFWETLFLTISTITVLVLSYIFISKMYTLLYNLKHDSYAHDDSINILKGQYYWQKDQITDIWARIFALEDENKQLKQRIHDLEMDTVSDIRELEQKFDYAEDLQPLVY